MTDSHSSSKIDFAVEYSCQYPLYYHVKQTGSLIASVGRVDCEGCHHAVSIKYCLQYFYAHHSLTVSVMAWVTAYRKIPGTSLSRTCIPAQSFHTV